MTKEVSITIEGLQLGSEEESMITEVMGTYHIHNDRHYILYEEKTDSEEDPTKNTIKISLAKVELTKKGKNFSQMVFDLSEITEAIYHTLYGNLCFEVKTSSISVVEVPENIEVKLEYTLSTNGAPMSENRIKIRITSQNS